MIDLLYDSKSKKFLLFFHSWCIWKFYQRCNWSIHYCLLLESHNAMDMIVLSADQQDIFRQWFQWKEQNLDQSAYSKAKYILIRLEMAPVVLKYHSNVNWNLYNFKIRRFNVWKCVSYVSGPALPLWNHKKSIDPLPYNMAHIIKQYG